MSIQYDLFGKKVKLNQGKPYVSPPEGKYDVIYADPPWRYDFSQSNSRAIESHYPSMDLEDICRLQIPANDDAVLFLWATNPKLIEALLVIEAWNFEYKTNRVWIKDKIGMGYYVRGQHELLLIATKGNISPPKPQNRPTSLIYGKRTDHSKKPLIYPVIEKMYPNQKYIELFARRSFPGWAVWGNDI